MKISIVTCTWNSEKYLPRSIRSVVEQSYPDIEYIFVDGGSTDGTLALIDEVQFPHRVIHGIQGGISNAMNVGAMAATGQIIAHIHSDDYYLHNQVLSNVAKGLTESGCRWGYGRIKELIEDKLVSERYIPPSFSASNLTRGNFIPHPATFVETSLMKHVGYFDTTLKYAMDYDLWLKISAIALPHEFKEPLAAFRRHPGSASTANALKAFLEDHQVRLRHAGQNPVTRLSHELRFLWRKHKLLKQLAPDT